MYEPLTQPLERSPTIAGLGVQATRLAPAPDRQRPRRQRGGRQPVDDTGPGGRRGNPPAPSITWGAAPADRQATCPPAHPVAPRPRSLWRPGRALDARTNHGRDSCGIWHRISSAPCRPFVQGPAVEPAKTRPTRPPARRRRDCQVARRDLAGHQKGAHAQGQTIFFVDESGFYPLPSVLHTYAPVGQTPILREWWTGDHLSAISGISPEGKLYFHYQDYAIASAAVVAFLAHLLREVSGRMVIIWDGAPIHRSQVIKEFRANGAAAAPRAPSSLCSRAQPW
jgi:DDE superfamily endonuclease